MTYKINGIEIPLQPTSGKWVDRTQKGFDGDGHPIYVAPREFELRWDFSDLDNTYTLQSWFDTVSASGTVTVEIPKYRSATWEFWEYSGTTLGEPTASDYFEKFESDIVLMIYGIRIK